MRDDKPENHRRVIILGAGASAGYVGTCAVSPPATKRFFEAAAKLWPTHLNSRFPSLNSFLHAYYGGNLEHPKEWDVEEVLTMVDLSKDEAVRVDLLRFIKDVLRETLEGPSCEHHKLLLMKMGRKDTIINFNWDLLIDNIVANSSPQYPDYGACSNVLSIKSSGPEYKRNLRHRPKQLKLHGSLNWMHCRRCNQTNAIMNQGKEPPHPCDSCSVSTEALIVPPTLLKSYNYGVIEEVWSQARIALEQASEIIVVGYSLPLTDFRAKWLFMEATKKSADSVTKKLRVFDIVFCGDAHDASRLKGRLASAFHVPESEIESTRGGIKEAAEALEEHSN